MLRQYLEIKRKYPGTLLFFRLGDFYELFNEDAKIGSRELDITLTARHKSGDNPIPMCGVPHHAAAGYISKLVKKGYRVAICEQTEDAEQGKLVNREVVRVITPGTAIDEQLLEKKESIFLASVVGAGEIFGVAYLELSTGEFSATQIEGKDAFNKICGDIEAHAPRELLFPESLQKLIESCFANTVSQRNLSEGNVVQFNQQQTAPKFTTVLTALDDWIYNAEDCTKLLCRQFGTRELAGYGIDRKTQAIRAAGACLHYAQETQKRSAEHIADINYFEANDFMILDAVTLDNLEIIESRGSKKRSLLGVIDQTVTGMGARLLRSWLLRPSIKRSEIQTRLSAVSELTDSIFRDKIRFLLREVADLERLVGRLNLGAATPRDLLSLNRSISQTPTINETLSDANSLLLQVLSENIFELPEIRNLIENAISDEPPANFNDGGVIKDNFHEELDEIRNISKNAKQTIASFEESEKRRTNIANLKVKFNSVFGYFIEISKGNVKYVPENYERRQTLTNAERYTTPELKDWEAKVLGAEERIKVLETEIFNDIRRTVREETRRLQATARALATLDALASLAEIATRHNYVAPVLHDGDEIEIKDGKHPIVEAFSSEPFIPNDLKMNNSTDRLLIITGANMSGKSTVMRQIAMIQILGQIGSFVPATSAKLPIIDRIWTRVGASDDLASGRSTFMVEMTETAAILHNSTPKSLILLDEIGRGTSTFDGLSIAWAVAEYLHDSPEHSAKTLFATHYHELTELAENLAGAKNYRIKAAEKDGEIVFLHKLERGKASKSYGIAVAKLAGLPQKTIIRAQQVLEKLEQYELAVFNDETVNKKSVDALETAVGRAAARKAVTQVSLFALNNESVIDELRGLNIRELSGDELKDLIGNIQKKLI